MFGDHLVGIYEKAFAPKTSWSEKLRRASKLGFDYIEISIDETDERLSRLDWSRAQKKQLIDDIWNSGIQYSQCVLAVTADFHSEVQMSVLEKKHTKSWIKL